MLESIQTQAAKTHGHTQAHLTADKIVLVALSGAQVPTASPARELCTSRWFTFARAYAESRACPWLLLSARYGLVSPRQIIPPHMADVGNMPAKQRRNWGQAVGEEARRRLPFTRQIVLLAGSKYVNALLPHLRELADEVHTPLAGLAVGYQCGWLRCNSLAERETSSAIAGQSTHQAATSAGC